jgi:hypothetical protein
MVYASIISTIKIRNLMIKSDYLTEVFHFLPNNQT